MNVSEKRVPQYLSFSAIGLSIGLCLYLWDAGAKDPARFVAAMEENHHQGYYGSAADCYDCHVPDKGTHSLVTAPTCVTGSCHGELMPSVSLEAGIERVVKSKSSEDRQPRAEYYIQHHFPLKGTECWSCHAEHKPGGPERPGEWVSYAEWLKEDGTRRAAEN